MNNRNYEIKVRLTQAEMVHLNRLVNGSKLSREAYLRQLISGVVPQDAPPPDYFSMMQQRVSDALCREYNLSVIRNPKGRGKHYGEWKAEQQGRPTLRSVIRSDIDRAILASTTQRNFQEAIHNIIHPTTRRTSNRLPMPEPVRKGFRRYSCAVLTGSMILGLTMPAYAANDPLTVVNNLSTFIFGLIRAVGLILLGWGIVQVGLSLQSHDPSQRSNGFLTLAGGIVITFAKEILDLIIA